MASSALSGVSGAVRDGPEEPPRDEPTEGRDDAEERWDIAMGQKRWFAEYVRVLCEYDNVGGMQVADSVRRHSSNKIRQEVFKRLGWGMQSILDI
jgi:hypothetical protein